MRGPKSRFAALSFVLAAGLASGCNGGGSSPTEPAPNPDSITLLSITPAQSTTLTAGSQVTFAGRVSYTLNSAATGHISLVIQDQSVRSLSSAQPRAEITRGSGSAELADTVTIPASGVTSVDVFFPLFPQGAANTNVVQRVTYQVR